jgi:peptide/nickel transport system substrate-binding protein
MENHIVNNGTRALKVLILSAGLLVMAFMLAACSSDDPTAAPAASSTGSTSSEVAEESKYGGIANFSARTDPPRGWDPMSSGSISVLMIDGSLFGMGNLVRQCPDDGTAVCDNLSDTWSANADSTQWTFHIRDGVTWHDGTPFTAEDGKFFIDLATFGATTGDNVRRPNGAWKFVRSVEKTTATDASTLVVDLKYSVPDFDQLLSVDNQVLAHPKHLMQPEIDAGNVNVSPKDVGWIGTGPFMMESYTPGSVAKVRRYDSYYRSDEEGNRLPYLDGIDFYITPDPAGMDAAFRTGRLDATARGSGFQLTPERENAIIDTLGADKVQIMKMAQSSFWALAFNTLRDTPLKDLKVRQAIHLWLDRQELVEVTFGGFGKVTGMYDPDTEWAVTGLMDTPGWNAATKAADRTAAKALLAEAGYADGFEAEFMCRRQWGFVCEPIVGQLEALGISVKLELVDDATRASRTLDAAYDMNMAGPTVALPAQYGSLVASHADSPTADPKHADAKVDGFFRSLESASTVAERSAISKEMEQYMAVDMVYAAWLYTEEAHSVVRDYVKGVQVPADNYRRNLDFATVWLDK